MSTAGLSVDLRRELRAICGEQHVAERVSGSTIGVSPASTEEAVAIVRLANQHNFGITPTRGNSERTPAQARTEVLLHMDRLNQIEHYDPADLTIGIGAGMSVGQLNALVGADNLMFACDPADPECASIGGVLAAAKHGPLRHGYGGVRDFCTGVRFVTGDGRRAKGGGRVVKNVAGYDVMKLLIGSYGTLAVITSASFKLFPAPRQTRTFLAEFASWQEALKFRDRMVHSPLSPMSLEIVSPQARKLMRPEMTDHAWTICVRVSGSDAVLARYRKELGSAVTRELAGESETQMWRAIENFPASQNLVQDLPPSLTWTHPGAFSLFAPPAELGSVIKVLEDTSVPGVTTAAYIGRCGIGHLLVHFVIGNPEWDPQMQARMVRQQLPSSVQFFRKWEELHSFPQMKAVKRALDPNRVLMRGRELF